MTIPECCSDCDDDEHFEEAASSTMLFRPSGDDPKKRHVYTTATQAIGQAFSKTPGTTVLGCLWYSSRTHA